MARAVCDRRPLPCSWEENWETIYRIWCIRTTSPQHHVQRPQKGSQQTPPRYMRHEVPGASQGWKRLSSTRPIRIVHCHPHLTPNDAVAPAHRPLPQPQASRPALSLRQPWTFASVPLGCTTSATTSYHSLRFLALLHRARQNMKVATILLAASSAASVSAVSLFSTGGDQAVINEDFKVPGDNPLYFCADPKDYLLDLENVDLSPNPPVPFVFPCSQVGHSCTDVVYVGDRRLALPPRATSRRRSRRAPRRISSSSTTNTLP